MAALAGVFSKKLAEGAVSTVDRLLSISRNNQNNYDVVSSKIESMLEELSSKIKAINEDIVKMEEEGSSSPRARKWLGKAEYALLEVDRLLDGITYLVVEANQNLSFFKKVRLFFLTFQIPTQINHIQKILDYIISIKNKREEEEELNAEQTTTASSSLLKKTTSSVVVEPVFGRENDKDSIIVNMLLPQHQGGEEFFSENAIVGFGGYGKTVLAQYVFNDPRITHHFHYRWWVSCANLSSENEILFQLIKSVPGIDVRLLDSLPVDQLQKRILLLLLEGRYLLVLDDLCVDYASLTSLRSLLKRGYSGSKVLITTRPENVNVKVNVAPDQDMIQVFELPHLSDRFCWDLFKTFAFQTSEPTENKLKLGKQIVTRCRNVPLTIKLVAEILNNKSDNEWLHFSDDNLDIIEICNRNSNDYVYNLFKPSYDNLEAHLKVALAYCSLFPVGYQFCKNDLIHLLAVQGFTNLPSNLEGDGDEFFKELIEMRFFQVVKCDAFGAITSFKMHHMVHHLSRRAFGARSIVVSPNFCEVDDKTLHMCVRFDGRFFERFFKTLFHASSLRTLILQKESMYGGKLERSTCRMLLTKFKGIRVLDLHSCDIVVLPNEVGNLISLRYFDLSKNDFLEALPSSMTNLYHLEVLKLNFCQKLKSLPKGIGKLSKLLCLEIDECDSLTCMPLGLGKLENLRTLNQFVVRKSSFDDTSNGGIRVLSALNKLQGKLKIELSGEWTTLVHEAAEANLKDKSKLTDLKIEWRLGDVDDNHACYTYVTLLEHLQPPPSLKALCIEGYKGNGFPSWARMDRLGVSLPKLVIVSIEGCKNLKDLPPFGQLKQLKCLTLRHMERVEYVESSLFSTTTDFFPHLEELTLHSLFNLKKWRQEAGEQEEEVLSFPRLLRLKIWNCPKLENMPLFPFVEKIDFQNVHKKLLEVPAYLQVKKLNHLQIKDCPNMGFFPAFGVGSGGSLKFLVIDKCDALGSLCKGFEKLNSLEKLELSHCRELCLDDLDWSILKCLRHLVFRGIPKLRYVPEKLKSVGTLEFLSIATCSGLSALPNWIDQMQLLQHIKIEACHRLTSLPSSMRNLNLDRLEITECPKLMESCSEPNGKCWRYIQHIPLVLLHKSWRHDL